MGYYDEHGNQLNPDLIQTPSLCVACEKHHAGDQEEVIFCNLTRLNQQHDDEFSCSAYVPVNAEVQ